MQFRFLLTLCLLITVFAAGLLVGQEAQPIDWQKQAIHWQAQLNLCQAQTAAVEAFKTIQEGCTGGKIELRDKILVCVTPK